MLVVGAGIGGLCAALSLERAGVQVTVFEQGSDLRSLQVGGGIHLWNNAMVALDDLGVATAVEDSGHAIDSFTWYAADGSVLGSGDVGELNRGTGVASVGLTRGDLHQVLAGALGEGALHLGRECTGFSEDDSGVTARFADGGEERGDALIGADGLRSVVRRQLHGESEPRYAGVSVYQAEAQPRPGLVDPSVYGLIWGRGGRLGFYPITRGTFWFATLGAPQGQAATRPDPKGAVLERVREWGETARELVEATAPEAISVGDIVARDPIDTWGRGPVTLLGDAAHPMTPFVGQGACQAIEDAAVLGRCFRSGQSAVSALRGYEEARIPRTSEIVNISWRIGHPGRISNPLACALRNQAFKLLFGRAIWKGQRRMILHDFWPSGGST